MTSPGRFRDLDGHDAYEVLGVSPTATRRELSRARRERQRTAHPDHVGAADDFSKLINAAADILLDETLRRDYDLWRRQKDETPPSPAEPAPSAWDDVERGFGSSSLWDEAGAGYRPSPDPSPRQPLSPYRGTTPPPTPGPVPGPGPGMAPQYGSPHVMPHLGQPAPEYYHAPGGQRSGAGKIVLIVALALSGSCMLMCLLNALLVGR